VKLVFNHSCHLQPTIHVIYEENANLNKVFLQHMQAMASDSPVYYSCDDDDDDEFNEAIASYQELQISPSQPPSLKAIASMKKGFRYITRPVVLLGKKLMTPICSLPIGTSAVGPTPAVDSTSHTDQILPCLERLKKLEEMVEELRTKPWLPFCSL